MSRFPSLPLFTDAFIADTGHLSLEQRGAYLMLLMIAWRSPGCALPNDDRKLARMLGITSKRWAGLKPEVLAFWTLTEDRWMQKRLTREHDFVAEKVLKKRDAGSKGGRPKSLKNNDQGKASGSENKKQNESKTKAPNPNPIQTPSETTSLQDAPDPGTSPTLSLKDKLWIEGKASLIAMGVKDAKAGSMIGKWLRDSEGDAGRILWAIDEAYRQASGDPVPYVTRLLSNSPTTSRGRAPGPPAKDGIATLLRELEGRTNERNHGGDHQGRGGAHPGGHAGDVPHQQRFGADGGPILDLEPIRPDRR